MTTATARIQFMDNVEKAKREGRTEGSVNAQPNLSHLGKRIAAASIGAVLTSLLSKKNKFQMFLLDLLIECFVVDDSDAV